MGRIYTEEANRPDEVLNESFSEKFILRKSLKSRALA